MLAQAHMAKSQSSNLHREMQVILDNIANANTVGFKKNIMQFEAMFPQVYQSVIAEFQDPATPIDKKRRKNAEFGPGTRIVEIEKKMVQGSFEVTNRKLDLAIEGDGFFSVKMPNGTTAYTRSGNFSMNGDGVLVDPNGHPMEPTIQIPRNTIETTITPDGKVFAHFKDQPVPRQIGQIPLTVFRAPEQLKGAGQNLFLETVSSGAPETKIVGQDIFSKIRQGTLEMSNVNLVHEMMNVLLTQRSFELLNGAQNIFNDLVKYALEIPK